MTEGMVICRAAKLRRETEGSRIKIVIWKIFFFSARNNPQCRCFGSALEVRSRVRLDVLEEIRKKPRIAVSLASVTPQVLTEGGHVVYS